MGIPEMEKFWNALCTDMKQAAANSDTVRLYNRIQKAMKLLAENPHHPGLQSHRISSLSKRYGKDVWESYLQNHTPSAGRLFWAYGPGKNDITILGVEPHPNDRGAYKRVRLSSFGEIDST